MLQELGINIKKTFVPQKTTDSQPTLKHGSKKHHTSFEVLFDQDETKVSASFLLSYTINWLLIVFPNGIRTDNIIYRVYRTLCIRYTGCIVRSVYDIQGASYTLYMIYRAYGTPCISYTERTIHPVYHIQSVRYTLYIIYRVYRTPCIQGILYAGRTIYRAYYIQGVLYSGRTIYKAYYIQGVLYTGRTIYKAYYIQGMIYTGLTYIYYLLFTNRKN